MQSIDKIYGYHAHIYFDVNSRAFAVDELYEALSKAFPSVRMGRVHDRAVGPHPQSMYQVAFAPEVFEQIVPFLMLNATDLSVLIHPETGNDLLDHTKHALWLGELLPLRTEIFE